MDPHNDCAFCGGTGLIEGEACLECADDVALDVVTLAAERYAQDGTPCATCTCSFMSLKQAAGTSLGFSAGGGLTLRVCRKGREPLTAEGGTGELWCPDYSAFAEIVPVSGDDLDRLQTECTRGFLADLAQGIRPLPRTGKDLRWYDRGLREGWLPPHRVEVGATDRGDRITGPWGQFIVVGVTPAFGDGHTPAVGEAILQAKDRRTYLLPRDADAPEVRGIAQSHGWWVSQVSSGAALPVERPLEAFQGARALVVRGGERVLTTNSLQYLPADAVRVALCRLADESLKSAESALRRGQPMVAQLCVRRGLRADPAHDGLLTAQRGFKT